MGKFQSNLFSRPCNRSVRIEARPERSSADAGALLLRELTDRLGYPALFGRHLHDPRDAARIPYPQE